MNICFTDHTHWPSAPPHFRVMGDMFGRLIITHSKSHTGPTFNYYNLIVYIKSFIHVQ